VVIHTGVSLAETKGVKEFYMKAFMVTLLFFGANAFASPTPNPTDGQIAQILLTANDLEIQAGKIAAEKSPDKDIKNLAKEIVREHVANRDAIQRTLKRAKVTAEDSVTKKILEEDFATYDEDLKAKTGKRFDLAYVYHEVSFHEAMIASIDDTLAPNAKNDSLRNLLTDYRAIQKKHLGTAKLAKLAIDAAPDREALPKP
jgi:putative membrane protein